MTLKEAIEQSVKLEKDAEGMAAMCRGEILRIDEALGALQYPPKAERPRCGAQTRSGGLCAAPAVRGGSHCRIHGGGGFDAVDIQRRMLRRERRDMVAYLAVCEGLAGRSARRVWERHQRKRGSA